MKKKFVAVLFFCFLIFISFLFSGYIKVYYVLWGNGNRGECSFIELPNGRTVLIDGGGYSDKSSSWVDDFLNYLGVNTIDYMILTHGDSDHINGLKMVMENYTVRNFYCTGETEVIGMEYIQPDCNVWKISDFSGNFYDCYLSGKNFNYGENWDTSVDVRVLSADDNATGNERSLVIKLSYGESSFYFGGDATGNIENFIMSNIKDVAPIDIFKAEHHGSDTEGSNSQSFISWIKPKFVIVPSGGRSAPPPASNTIKRFIDNKIPIYTTYLDGTILIKADNKGNYDIVRMNAVNSITFTTDYIVFPKPKAFPSHVYAGDFTVSSNMPYVLPPPDLPDGLKVISRTKDSVTLDWNYDTSPSIEGYYIFYSTVQGGDPGANNGWINPGMTEETGIYIRYNDIPISSHPYTVSNLNPDTMYYFRLSVITTYYYERRYSDEVSTRTLPLMSIVSSIPCDGESGLDIDTSKFILNFSSEIDTSSVNSNSFSILRVMDKEGNFVNESVSFSYNVYTTSVTLTLLDDLEYNSKYEIHISSSLKDLNGNELKEEKIISFRTVMNTSEYNVIIEKGVRLKIPQNSISVSEAYAEIDIVDNSTIEEATEKLRYFPDPHLQISSNYYFIKIYDGNGDPVDSFENEITVEFDSTKENSVPYKLDENLRLWVRIPEYDYVSGRIRIKVKTLSYFVLVSEGKFSLSEIKCYPNPATDLVTFDGLSSDTRINIYTIYGKKVKSKKFLSDGTNYKLTFDLKDLSSGLYFWEAISYEGAEIRDRKVGRLVIVR